MSLPSPAPTPTPTPADSTPPKWADYILNYAHIVNDGLRVAVLDGIAGGDDDALQALKLADAKAEELLFLLIGIIHHHGLDNVPLNPEQGR